MAAADRSASDPLTEQRRGAGGATATDGVARANTERESRGEAPERSRSDESVYHLLRRIAAYPHAFDFYHALRLIECEAPERPRIGASISVAQDPVRFGQEPTLAFCANTLERVESGRAGRAPRLYVNFMGLLGPNGPMPLHVTEYVRERVIQHHDTSPARFLDVFHHRMVSLFFRAWAVNQPTISRDRPASDRFAGYVASLVGLGSEAFRGRDAAPDDAKLHYAGLLGSHTTHAEGLESLVADFFKVPCRLAQFVGEWLDLPEESVCRLGESPETGTLGSTLVVGSRIWDVQHRFRLILGPMRLGDFERFLPTGSSFERLVAWVRGYCGFEYTWDVQLLLEASEVPEIRLGLAGRLGWTTWLRTGPYPRDADQVTLRPPA